MEIDFDILVPNFRQAKEHWSDAPTLSSHYQSLIDSYTTNSFTLIETIKSFIESVCLTILVEFGKSMPASDPSTTDMLVETLKCLGFQNTRGASKLDKVLSAYNRLGDALSEMRNEHGPIAHGKDGFLDNLSNNHRRAFLLIGDTLIGLLLSALEGKEPDLKFTREPYERFSHFHDRIDYSVVVETSIRDDEELPIIEVKMRTGNLSDDITLLIEPSKLLYYMDRTAYTELLAASEIEPAEIPEPEEAIVQSKAVPEVVVTQDTSPAMEIQKSYSGILLPLKVEFEGYLGTLGISNTLVTLEGENIIDSLFATAERNMGTDWTEREMLQAKMKIALRRVLLQFGIDAKNATNFAEHLVTWFKKQSAGIGSVSPSQGERVKTIGILAYGSLIADPGSEIQSLTRQTIADIETPFAVEYARTSDTRSGAPTLVPVENEKGIPVKAVIFILNQETDINIAKDILYRREKHEVGDLETVYQFPNAITEDTVIIEQIEGFHNVEMVLYTRIGVNIPQITDNSLPNESKAQVLANLAINSVTRETFSKKEDGIYYLDSAIQNGILTKLTEPYKQAILNLSDNSPNLEEARLRIAERNNIHL
jgi:abortive infection Abi-like protein